MIKFLSYYKSIFSHLFLYAIEESYAKIKEYNDLDDDKRDEYIKKNKPILKQCLVDLDIDKDKRLSYIKDNQKWDIEKSTLINNDYEDFVEKLLSDLWLDNYALDDNWISIEDLSQKIESFEWQKKDTLKQSQNERFKLASEILQTIEVDSYSWAKKLFAQLINTDTNWFLSEDLWNEWQIPALLLMTFVKDTSDETLLKQIKSILWDKLKWDSVGELLSSFDGLSSSEADKLKSYFTENLANKTRSLLNIKKFLAWQTDNLDWVEKESKVDFLKSWVDKQIQEIDLEIDKNGNDEKKFKELQSKRQELLEVSGRLWSITELDVAWLFEWWWELNSWGLSIKVGTWLKYPKDISIWLTSDWDSMKWWFGLSLPLYKNTDWSFSLGAWVWMSWWETGPNASAWLGAKIRVIEWTKETEFSQSIDWSWHINLYNIVFDKSVSLWAGWNLWLESMWLSIWAWIEISREFKPTLDRLVNWFRKLLKSLNFDRKIKISDVQTEILDKITDSKTKDFVKLAIEQDITNWVSKSNEINVQESLARQFSNELIHAMVDKWWAVQSIWVWASLFDGWIITWLLGKFSIFSEKVNQKDQSNYKISETKVFNEWKLSSIIQMKNYLSDLKIDWLFFVSKWKDQIKVFVRNWVNVLDRLNICAPKGKLNDFLSYDKNENTLTFSVKWLKLEDFYSTNWDELKLNRFLYLWWSSKSDLVTQEDLDKLSSTITSNNSIDDWSPLSLDYSVSTPVSEKTLWEFKLWTWVAYKHKNEKDKNSSHWEKKLSNKKDINKKNLKIWAKSDEKKMESIKLGSPKKEVIVPQSAPKEVKDAANIVNKDNTDRNKRWNESLKTEDSVDKFDEDISKRLDELYDKKMSDEILDGDPIADSIIQEEIDRLENILGNHSEAYDKLYESGFYDEDYETDEIDLDDETDE